MKKLLFAVAIITISSASVNAQDNEMKSNGTTFSIAGNVGTGTKKGYKIAYGADVQAEFPATTGLKITASAGYQHFNFKYDFGSPIGTVKSNYDVIPLLAGAKFALGKGLYGHPQLGYSFLTNKVSGSNQNNGEFTYAASIGYGFGKNLDLSLKYLSVDVVNAVLLRLAYNF